MSHSYPPNYDETKHEELVDITVHAQQTSDSHVNNDNYTSPHKILRKHATSKTEQYYDEKETIQRMKKKQIEESPEYKKKQEKENEKHQRYSQIINNIIPLIIDDIYSKIDIESKNGHYSMKYKRNLPEFKGMSKNDVSKFTRLIGTKILCELKKSGYHVSDDFVRLSFFFPYFLQKHVGWCYYEADISWH